MLIQLLPLALATIANPAVQAGLERAAVAAVVEPVLREKDIPGAVIGLLRGDRLIVREAFGLRDVASAASMEPETLFQVASVTKAFTATLLELLSAEGSISTDDTLATHLGGECDLPDALGTITLRQLATHTSALPRDPVNRRNLPHSPGVMLPYSVHDLYAGLERTSLEGQPGQEWSYSNLGYAILGHVLERAAGMSFEELLRERILDPLAMPSSGIAVSTQVAERLATHYWPEDAERVARAPWQFGQVAAFAGLHSNVDDLARFLVAQYDTDKTTLLPASVRRSLHEPTIEIAQMPGRSMARGWFVDSLPGLGQLVGHGGEVDGHSAIIAFLPQARCGIIVLANMGGDSAEAICMALMGGLLPSLLAKR